MLNPKYIAIAAITLDGRIAATSKHPSDWTSLEDKKFLHQMLNRCDVILVGNNTFKTAKKPLSKRNCIVFTYSPSPSGRGIKGEGSKHIYKKNQNLLYCNPSKIDLAKLIKKLGYKKVAILGGAQAYSYCLENNMLDELYLTIEPLVFGKGISLFAPFSPPQDMERVPAGRERLKYYNFKLISLKKLNPQGTLLLHYKLDSTL